MTEISNNNSLLNKGFYFFHTTINQGLEWPWIAYVFTITYPCTFYLLTLSVAFVLMITRWKLNLQTSCQYSQERKKKLVKGKKSKR